MPNWKKIITSGSDASFNSIHIDGAVTASVISGSFIGDGSGLSGVTSYTDTDTLSYINSLSVLSGSITDILNNTVLTGNPTAPTQTGTDDSTKIATTAFVQGRIDDLIGTAGSALDTFGELSASLAADQSGLASLTTTVSGKLQKDQNLSDLSNVSTARTNLGLGSSATTNSTDYATAAQGTKADTAHGWGNHASAGYLTSYTDTNYYLDGITKSGNTLTFSVNGTTNQTYTFGANAFNSTTIPTNNNQLTNGAGYITGYTETDTLAAVTGRGATTTTDITVGDIFSIKGSTPYIRWQNSGGTRLGYIQHNETDLVASSDTGKIILDPASGDVEVQGALQVVSSTSGETVFEVTGTSGQLFSIDDSLTGEIFAVSDISGIPILSVNASGIVDIDSTLRVTGDITAYHSSDSRLKKNIKPIENPLEKIKLLSGNTFDWDEENTAHGNKGADVGVIAQEVEKVLPEIVKERKGGYKGVQYEKIVALLIESNKALLTRIEELESKIK
jgi:hypothetical protein